MARIHCLGKPKYSHDKKVHHARTGANKSCMICDRRNIYTQGYPYKMLQQKERKRKTKCKCVLGVPIYKCTYRTVDPLESKLKWRG